jgi:hypothetical protein
MNDEEEKAKQAIDLWESNWPNACPLCEAWGGSDSVEQAGEFLCSVWDDCPDCIEQGKCPRCGKELFEDAGEKYQEVWSEWIVDQNPCPNCGWTWGKNAGDTRPQEWEPGYSQEEYEEERG